MMKIRYRLLAVLLTAAMAAALLAGCRRVPDSLYVPPEFVFVPEIISLPGELGDVGSLVLSGDKLFIANYNYTEGTAENGFVFSSFAEMFSMDINGENFTKLPNYTPPAEFGEGVSGGYYISNMKADPDGGLWVFENWNMGRYNLPDDFDPETGNIWEYEYQDLGSGYGLRKLDPTGAEIQSISLTETFGEREWLYVYAIGVDGDGNIYIAVESENWERGGLEIYVLDRLGNKLFLIETDRWVQQLISLADGVVAFESYRQDEENGEVRVLQTIDVAAEGFGEAFDIPQIPNFYGQILPGSGDYDILLSDFNSIYAYSLGDEEAVKLLSWLDTDVVNNNIQNIVMISEDKLICTNSVYNRADYTSSLELLILTRMPYSELPERTVLTLATFDSYSVRDAVVAYNRASPQYRIQIIDYSQYNTEDDWNAGVTRLSTELISGKVPDILCLSSWRVNYKEYVARGLLADLYPFIDADPELSRSSFVDNVFAAAEIEGSLYQVFSTFSINSLIGHPLVVGTEMGWNMEEFTAVLDANPQADMPLGQWLTKTNFLQAAVSYAIDDYINWGTGTTNFDSPHFVQLLEFCNTFPDDIDYENIDYETFQWLSDDELIATGRMLMQQTQVSDFESIMWLKRNFGGEITFKGFPTENRNGNSLNVDLGYAIIETSRNKDAAWDFVRTVLDGDWQLQNNWWGFPTNKEAFDTRAGQAFDLEFDFGGIVTYRSASGSSAEILAPGYEEEPVSRTVKFSQEDLDQIIALINVASGTAGWNMDQTIWEIINEEASDYFSGLTSAQEAAKDIQSRVSIFVSERS